MSPIVRTCQHCGNPKKIKPYQAETFKFCSNQCKWRYHSEHQTVELSCRVCSKPFRVIDFRQKTAKFCSRRCYYRDIHLRGTVEVACRLCGKVVRSAPSHKRIYCSRRCTGMAKRTTPAGSFMYVRKKLLRAELLKACYQCGYDTHPEILEVHHVDHDRKNNHWSNLAVTCPNCHKLHHYKNHASLPFRTVADIAPEFTA